MAVEVLEGEWRWGPREDTWMAQVVSRMPPEALVAMDYALEQGAIPWEAWAGERTMGGYVVLDLSGVMRRETVRKRLEDSGWGRGGWGPWRMSYSVRKARAAESPGT